MTLYLFTWRHLSIDNNPATFSAVAKTKEEAVSFIMQKLEECKTFSAKKLAWKWNWSAGEESLVKQRNAFYEMQHKEVPNALLVQGSFCSDFHTVLEKRSDDDDSEGTNEDAKKAFHNFLLTKEPTECQPMCEGFVIMTSNLDG